MKNKLKREKEKYKKSMTEVFCYSNFYRQKAIENRPKIIKNLCEKVTLIILEEMKKASDSGQLVCKVQIPNGVILFSDISAFYNNCFMKATNAILMQVINDCRLKSNNFFIDVITYCDIKGDTVLKVVF